MIIKSRYCAEDELKLRTIKQNFKRGDQVIVYNKIIASGNKKKAAFCC